MRPGTVASKSLDAQRVRGSAEGGNASGGTGKNGHSSLRPGSSTIWRSAARKQLESNDVWGGSGAPAPESGPVKSLAKLVGAEGFEPPTLWSQTRCATRLRYAPTSRPLSHVDRTHAVAFCCEHTVAQRQLIECRVAARPEDGRSCRDAAVEPILVTVRRRNGRDRTTCRDGHVRVT